ncbi:MAG: hypothetical protein CME32_12610 [Gimesia sp.]|nr:hypothetical protein [Gimesia sp.]
MAYILVVDDLADNRRTMVRVLSILGHSSETASNAADAVSMSKSHDFDMILMDIAIPLKPHEEHNIYGGLEATNQILSHSYLRNLPIIAVTAHGMDEQKQAILDCGCVDIIEKGCENFISRTKDIISLHLPSHKNSPSKTKEIEPRNNERKDSLNEEVSGTIFPKAKSISIHLDQTDILGKDLIQNNKDADFFKTDDFENIRVLILQAKQTAISVRSQLKICKSQMELFPQIDQLVLSTQTAFNRLTGMDSLPCEGESIYHWLANLLLGANGDCELIIFNMKNEQVEDDIHREIVQIHTYLSQALKIGQELIDASSKASLVTPNKNVTFQEEAKKESREIFVLSNSTEKLSPFIANILIVDDEWEARRTLEKLIQQLNHRVFSCGDGESALQLLMNQNFDACLLDLHMPEIDGLELISRIRAISRLKHLPLIVISGSGQLDDAVRAIEIGANDYLQKPPHLALLKARIETCLKQGELRRQELKKFLPPNVIDMVMNAPEQMQHGRPAEITVLFGDIRDFSTISDKIGAAETIRWVSETMNCLTKIILEYGGTLVDYIGDEIMAMWGAPKDDPEHAVKACRCAIAMQSGIHELNIQWENRLGLPMQIGIGIHSGTAVVGNTGSEHRFKYGPLGSTVNIASRVQGATKYLRSLIVITKNTASGISEDLRGRKLCDVKATNIPSILELYELRLFEDYQLQQRDKKYEEALSFFEKKLFHQAIQILSSLLAEHPKDGPTQLLLSRTIQGEFNGISDNIWTLPGK